VIPGSIPSKTLPRKFQLYDPLSTSLHSLEAYSRPSNSRQQKKVLRGNLLAVGCWLLAVGCWLLAVGYWLLAVGCFLRMRRAGRHSGQRTDCSASIESWGRDPSCVNRAKVRGMRDEGCYPGTTLPLLDGIMWVWLTDGRVGWNLLENEINQHWRWVSDNIPGGRNQEKSPFFPLSYHKGGRRGIFQAESLQSTADSKMKDMQGESVGRWLLAVGYLPPVAWYRFSGDE
jgi:hypothetical protein